jgi:hypothetical protein
MVPPVGSKHAQALGHVAANWGRVDDRLGFIIIMALGSSAAVGVAVTAELSSVQRINLLTVLINATNERVWIDRWAHILPTLQRLRTKRNDVLHAFWQVDGEQHFSLRESARTRINWVHGPVETEDIVQIADDIMSLFWELVDLLEELSAGGFADKLKLTKMTRPPPAGTRTPSAPGQDQVHTPSQKALELEAARDAKRAKRQADRESTARHLAQKKKPDGG